MTFSAPQPGLSEELANFAAKERILVALDFDGTLAPLVDVPAKARALPEAGQAILRLTQLPNTYVALVSGRTLDSLIAVASPKPDMFLVGSHGYEMHFCGQNMSESLNALEQAQLDILGKILNELADTITGAWVESKTAGAALHTRLSTVQDAKVLYRIAASRVREELGEMGVRAGKNVLEFSVRQANKGDAVNRLREHTRADAVFYAGDDTTDEDVFRVLKPGDVGLKVGKDATLATLRVADPGEVVEVLGKLLAFRGQIGITSVR